jgi:hypothetical protein
MKAYVITEISEGDLCGTHIHSSLDGAVAAINSIFKEYHDDHQGEGEAEQQTVKSLKRILNADWDLPGDEMGQSKLHFEVKKVKD